MPENSKKNFIEEIFAKRGSTPEDAKTIAGQLKLNEAEMYSERKRFVFELIQNADDMPENDKAVSINMVHSGDFFLFRHDGNPFSEDDISSICNAASSSKAGDKAKTGYKGIGFKSVFSVSDHVSIFSNGYNFSFNREDEVYKDWRKLYQQTIKDFNEERRIKFEKECESNPNILKIENIPWQIKPLWVEKDNLSEEEKWLITSSGNVDIVLGISEEKVSFNDFKSDLHEVMSDPRILLFLRNTQRLDYTDSEGNKLFMEADDSVKSDGTVTTIRNGNEESSFLYSDFEIEISEEKLQKVEFDLAKGNNPDTAILINRRNGNKSEIPTKFIDQDKIKISFAVPLKDGRINPYEQGMSLLYNYLPTKERSFDFPFLLNTDFILTSNREHLLTENTWNQFLFYHIGQLLVKWVSELAKSEVWRSDCLKLLPVDLFDENLIESAAISKTFNQGFLNTLNTTPVIPNENGELFLSDQTVMDNTGLSQIIGSAPFLKLIGSDLTLSAPDFRNDLDVRKYLCKSEIDKGELKKYIRDNRFFFDSVISELSIDSYKEFLIWFDKFGMWDSVIKYIKFIRAGQIHGSPNEMQEIILNDRRLDPAMTLIKKYGGKITDFDPKEFKDLNRIISIYYRSFTILNRMNRLFTPNISNIGAEERDILIKTLLNFDDISYGLIAGLPWYLNASEPENEEVKPVKLNLLHDNQGFEAPKEFGIYFLKPEEREVLPQKLLKELKSISQLLDNKDFKLDFSSGDELNIKDERVRLLKLFLEIGENDEDIYRKLSIKIFFDGELLNRGLYRDEVQLECSTLDSQIHIEEFSLQDLLPELQNGSKKLKLLLNKLDFLEEIELEKLENNIFKLGNYPTHYIIRQLLSQGRQLSWIQTVYCLLNCWVVNDTELKINFGNGDNMKKYLQFLFTKNIKVRSSKYPGGEFFNSGKILSQTNEFVLESEIPEKWVLEWWGGDEEKFKFLIGNGFKSDTSSWDIKFRRALSERNWALAKDYLENIDWLRFREGNLCFLKDYIEEIVFSEKMVDLTVEFCNKYKTRQGTKKNFGVVFDSDLKKIRIADWQLNRTYYSCAVKGLKNSSKEIIKLINEKDAVLIPIEQNSISQIKLKEIPQEVLEESSREYRKYFESEEELEAFNKLFNFQLGKDDMAEWNLVAIFHGLKYFEGNGYDVTSARSNPENIKKSRKFNVDKNGKRLTVIPRSAKRNLLYVSKNVWDDLGSGNVQIFALSKNKNKLTFASQEELLMQDNKLIFQFSSENNFSRVEIANNVFKAQPYNRLVIEPEDKAVGDCISASYEEDKLWMIVRLNNDSEYESIFSDRELFNEK